MRLPLNDVKMFRIRPRISTPLTKAKAAPSSLFTHPSITKFTMLSSMRDRTPNTRNVRANMIANETILSICSDAVMYSASWTPSTLANFADAQTPAMMEMMALACDMNPFLKPCIKDGIRQIKIMISNIFINTLKCVYLRIEIFGIIPDCKNR